MTTGWVRAAAFWRIGLALLLGGWGGSCTSASDPLFEAAASLPLHLQLSTEPPRGPGGVPRNAVIRIQLDGYPDPRTAVFGPVVLRSGKNAYDADIRVDLVGQALMVTPHTLLAPNTTYEVVVTTALRTLDGRRLDRSRVGQIAVGAETVPPEPVPPPPTWNADVAPLLATCAPVCHSRVGANGNPRAPTRRLDLTGDPADSSFGLIRVPSVGLAGTLYQLERVTPGKAASSLLLRKLIGGDAHLASQDGPYPEMGVEGRRMPIGLEERTPPPPPLSAGELERIQRWIDAGARVQ